MKIPAAPGRETWTLGRARPGIGPSKARQAGGVRPFGTMAHDLFGTRVDFPIATLMKF